MGARIITRHSRRSTTLAPSFSKRITSAGMSSVSMSMWTVHALDLHDGLVGRDLQHALIAAAARMVGIYGATQCLAPEAGRLVHIGGLAVDQHGAEAGLVHISASRHRWVNGDRAHV